MFLMWIGPVLLIGFVVYAISGNNVGNIFKPATSHVCSHCSQPVQNNWKVCPHCGKALK